MAMKVNTKMFVRIHGRQLQDYNEVQSWIYSFKHNENRLIARTIEAVM